MTLFVIIVYSIVLLVGAGALAYNIYEYFILEAEFKANPPYKVFIETYYEVKKERLQNEQHK
jgi:hypothetical protein